MTVDSAKDAESHGPDLLPDHREALHPGAPGGDAGPEASTLTGDPRGWASAAWPDGGGGSTVRRSVLRLQAQAGNAAVAALARRRANGGWGRQRTGPVLRRAAGADVTDTQESFPATGPGSEKTPTRNPRRSPAAPVPTSSFTKVGPPTRSPYTVSGTLRQAAEAVAARPEAGATIVTPVMDIDAQKRPTQSRCGAPGGRAPDWDGKAAATQNQRNEWDRFEAAITTHENGHVATDVTSFANAHVKVKAKPTVAEGDTEWNRIVGQATTDNDAFDAGNDHGRSAGTKINPNIDEVTKVP